MSENTALDLSLKRKHENNVNEELSKAENGSVCKKLKEEDACSDSHRHSLNSTSDIEVTSISAPSHTNKIHLVRHLNSNGRTTYTIDAKKIDIVSLPQGMDTKAVVKSWINSKKHDIRWKSSKTPIAYDTGMNLVVLAAKLKMAKEKYDAKHNKGTTTNTSTSAVQNSLGDRIQKQLVANSNVHSKISNTKGTVVLPWSSTGACAVPSTLTRALLTKAPTSIVKVVSPSKPNSSPTPNLPVVTLPKFPKAPKEAAQLLASMDQQFVLCSDDLPRRNDTLPLWPVLGAVGEQALKMDTSYLDKYLPAPDTYPQTLNQQELEAFEKYCVSALQADNLPKSCKKAVDLVRSFTEVSKKAVSFSRSRAVVTQRVAMTAISKPVHAVAGKQLYVVMRPPTSTSNSITSTAGTLKSLLASNSKLQLRLARSQDGKTVYLLQSNNPQATTSTPSTTTAQSALVCNSSQSDTSAMRSLLTAPTSQTTRAAIKQVLNKPIQRKHKCPECKYQTDNKSHLRRHQSSVHSADKIYRCYVCNKDFARSEKCKAHIIQDHPAVGYDARFIRKHAGQETEDSSKDNCEEQDKVEESVDDSHLAQDYSSEEEDKAIDLRVKVKPVESVTIKVSVPVPPPIKLPKPADYQCCLCSFIAPNDSSLDQHMASVHSKIPAYTCKQCDYTTSRKHRLVNHMKNHGCYDCPDCVFHTVDYMDFMSHTKSCPALRREVPCTLCGRMFTSINALASHQRQTHKPKALQILCDQCDFIANSPDQYRLHQQVKHHDLQHPLSIKTDNTPDNSSDIMTDVSNHDENMSVSEKPFASYQPKPFSSLLKNIASEKISLLEQTRLMIPEHKSKFSKDSVNSEKNYPELSRILNLNVSKQHLVNGRHNAASSTNELKFVCSKCGQSFGTTSGLCKHQCRETLQLSSQDEDEGEDCLLPLTVNCESHDEESSSPPNLTPVRGQSPRSPRTSHSLLMKRLLADDGAASPPHLSPECN